MLLFLSQCCFARKEKLVLSSIPVNEFFMLLLAEE